MVNTTDMTPQNNKQKSGFGIKQVLIIVVTSMLLTLVVTIVTIKLLFFPSPFTPVILPPDEEKALEQKIDSLSNLVPATSNHQTTAPTPQTLTPEKYSEADLSRSVTFSEKELNAIIAKNTDLADKVALDLSKDMISVKILIPMDPDFPMLGGKTLKVTAGAELAYKNAHPVVKLKGLALMGIPMPNAWLGGMKNVDLVKEFGDTDGFWKNFADGVESLQVVDGSLEITLKK